MQDFTHEALGIQSEKAPSIGIFGLQHLVVVEGSLKFGHNAPSIGHFYKLTNPVDAWDLKFRQRAYFNCIPSAAPEEPHEHNLFTGVFAPMTPYHAASR